MKPIFKVDLRGVDGMTRNIRLVRETFPEWLAEANAKTAEVVRKGARRNIRNIDAYATGTMYDSIQVTSSPGGLVFAVGSTAKYAPYVEFGTRPHWPPLDAIREWCRVKGIPESAAFPIARAIARRGLPERPFLYPALLEGMTKHARTIQAAVNSGLKRLLA
jgi:HK97 gp10 family phage protein